LIFSASAAKVDAEMNQIDLFPFGEGWSITTFIMTPDPKITEI
jgi:hypothetical protein